MTEDLDAPVPSSPRDPRLDLADHRPDLAGRVEATWRTAEPPDYVMRHALGYRCPGCVPNVFIAEHPEHDGQFEVKIAHDEACSWLAEHEREEAE